MFTPFKVVPSLHSSRKVPADQTLAPTYVYLSDEAQIFVYEGLLLVWSTECLMFHVQFIKFDTVIGICFLLWCYLCSYTPISPPDSKGYFDLMIKVRPSI